MSISARIRSNRDSIERYGPYLASWPGVLICTLLLRLLLNLPALMGSHLPFLQAPDSYANPGGVNPLTLPGVWLRWDSGYYLSIAARGYSYHGAEVAFLPGYPLVVRMASLGFASALPWAGVAISLLSFLPANVLLWKQISLDFSPAIAWGTIVTLNLFPTSFFFSAMYTESSFLLFSVLVYWFSARKRYWLAALFVALASITRVYGILLLVLLLAEMASDGWRQRPYRIMFVTGFAASLLVIYAGFCWVTQGSPLAPIVAQQNFRRSMTLPGLSLIHGLAVVLWGYGGFRDNWFMRAVSAQDSLAMMVFLACTIAGFFVLRRKSLALYGGVAMLALMVSHGPYALGVYSMSRYVLPIFPALIVMAIELTRLPKLKWLVWASMAILLCLLTAWFASGHWVA